MVENKLQDEAFRLKGRIFTLTVLELLPCRLENFQAQIETVYHKAPNMFANTPMVLDLKQLKGTAFDLKGVVETMKQFQMIPIAVQHASVIQQKAAIHAGLSVLQSKDGDEAKSLEKALANAASGAVVTNSIKHRANDRKVVDLSSGNCVSASEPAVKQPDNSSESSVSPAIKASSRRSKIVTQPVRSGQQVYAKDADLIILASVGTGAELLADGHIHVYGTLRGRALAGIQGDEQARIFCSQLQAELVSIAGQYRMPDPNDLVVQGAKQIFLEQNKIQITDL
jgi:septum site-determining protein MinC